MRNIFDQYTQPENQLTHALVCCLNNDRGLLGRFIRWAIDEETPPISSLKIVEQRLPGEEEPADEDEAERRGIPDAWIHDGNEWCLLIESKIESPLRRDQLERHLKTAERRGFANPRLLSLVTKNPQGSVPDRVKIVEWSKVYSWLCLQRASEWAKRVVDYMEILEGKLVAIEYLTEGTLTVFSGIPFGPDRPYSYPEAKRLLRLAMNQLRTRVDLQKELGMDPEGLGRPAITGKDVASAWGVWGVWDFLRLKEARRETIFTKCLHLTLSIQQERLFALVAIPNGIQSKYRRNFLAGGKEGFFGLFKQTHARIQEALREVGGTAPWIHLVQRRYRTQRSQPIVDASLEFDLRTAGCISTKKKEKPSIKIQPEWLQAVHDALTEKRSNLQLAVGAMFFYGRCPAANTREILDHIANVWLACRPLIRKVLG